MTNKHTALPWASDIDMIYAVNVPDDGGDIIANAPEYAEDSFRRWPENARLIVTAVNYHHRLREALISCAEQLDDDDPDSRCMDNIVSDKAHKLLAELDNMENNHE